MCSSHASIQTGERCSFLIGRKDKEKKKAQGAEGFLMSEQSILSLIAISLREKVNG